MDNNGETSTIDLATFQKELLDNEYVILCHGTLMSMDEIKEKIMKQGLLVTGYNENSSLFKTTNPVDVNCETNTLKSKLDNWPHDSKNIVFLKLPLNYFNICTPDQSDLDCQKTRAFTTKVYTDGGRYKYLIDSQFIVGAYNLETGYILENPNYEKDLSEKTILNLENKLIEVQKEMGIVEEINNGYGR